jgi:hypothetical protein
MPDAQRMIVNGQFDSRETMSRPEGERGDEGSE